MGSLAGHAHLEPRRLHRFVGAWALAVLLCSHRCLEPDNSLFHQLRTSCEPILTPWVWPDAVSICGAISPTCCLNVECTWICVSVLLRSRLLVTSRTPADRCARGPDK